MPPVAVPHVNGPPAMSLAEFIRTHHEEIIRAFSAFAQTLMPPGAEMTEAELRDYAKQHLAAFKVPVRIELRTEPLPRNANGKIMKRDLKRELGL